MKRTFLATFLSIVFAMVAVACHGSDEKEIGYAELPVQAQQFVKQYFPTATYSRVEKEKDNGNWEYEATLNDVFANVPHYDLDKNLLGGTAVDLFNQEGMQIFPSKSEMRKLVKGGGVSLNKEKLAAFDQVVTADDLIDGKYLLVQKGKKNYFLITVK